MATEKETHETWEDSGQLYVGAFTSKNLPFVTRAKTAAARVPMPEGAYVSDVFGNYAVMCYEWRNQRAPNPSAIAAVGFDGDSTRS